MLFSEDDFCGLIGKIPLCQRCVHIRHNEECADTEAKAAKDHPADEAEVQDEEFHLAAVCHLTACRKCLFPCVFRMINFDVPYHRKSHRHNDTRDDEKYTAKSDEEALEETHQEDLI